MSFLTSGRFQTALFFLVVAFYVGLIFWLPVFPTSDGSVHLYFSKITGLLSSHALPGSIYEQNYELRRLTGPYFLHYYATYLFSLVFGLALAEKLFIALVVVLIAFGFRYLAGVMGAQRELVCLLMTPFLLPWSLGAGFLNYTLSCGLLLWGVGAWQRLRDRLSVASLVVYLVILVALIFSHPIPLLLLICVSAGDLALILLERMRLHRALWTSESVRLGVCLVLSCVAFVVPMLVADVARMRQETGDFVGKSQIISTAFVSKFIHGALLTMPDSIPLLHVVYREGVFLLAPLSLLAVLWGVRKRFVEGEMRAADRLALSTLLLLATTFFMPPGISGGEHLAPRMLAPLWMMALAALAGGSLSVRQLRAGGVVALALVAVTVVESESLVKPAKTLARVDRVELPRGKAGVFLTAHNTIYEGLTYPVFYWSGARTFAQSDALLLNSPWLDISISPLARKVGSKLLYDPSAEATAREKLRKLSNNPQMLTESMVADGALRAEVLSRVDFVYYVDPSRDQRSMDDTLVKLGLKDEARWKCGGDDVYRLCEKR